MRVLLACASYPPHGKGGGPQSSQCIAVGLSERGHEVRVLTVAGQEKIEQRGKLDVKTICSLNVHWNYWVPNPTWRKLAWHLLENGNPNALMRMRREIREYHPDVMMTISIENINVATWLAARLENVPVVHLLHSYFLMCWRGSMFKNGHNCDSQCGTCRVSAVGKRLFSRFVFGVIGESTYIVDKHTRAGYFPSVPWRVIPGAVDVPALLTRTIGPEDHLRVGFIGFHGAHKGLDTLAYAAHYMKDDTTVSFVIAGDGEAGYTHILKQRFPSINTKFVGWLSPSHFYTAIDVVVVPSIWQEPFGRVSVEALSYGVPVIAARSGGLPENIQDGRNGFLFNPGDYLELARCIKLLAEDRALLRRLSGDAIAHARRFATAAIAESLENALDDIQKARRAGLNRL
jgi:glycosyltransferase involved in cell wall biosynthesis